MFFRLVFFFLFVALTPLVSFAANDQVIQSIAVEGNQRIEQGTILSYIGIKPGDMYDPIKVDAAIAALYETKLFDDVVIERRGSVVTIKVKENPVINEIAFEGNKRIDKGDLEKEMRLKPRSVLTKSDLQNDVNRLLAVYQKSGRFLAEVTPKVIQLDQNRVNLVFEISEGDKSLVRRIRFVGNKYYSAGTLRNSIQTKETAWYRFLSSDDSYDPDRLDFDKELLRRYYISKGFADFKVLSAVSELTPEKDSFYITFTIEEGQRYTFGKMSVQSHIEKVKIEPLQEIIASTPGEIFNAEEIDQTVDKMTEALGEQGYAFVNIDPQYNRDPKARTIGINYAIAETPRVYVDKINITGNVRTKDEVIRREFRLAEGDPYNVSKLRRSQQRLKNLGYFTNVDIQNQKGATPDKMNINVNVEEKSTGELTIGGGYSTSDGVLSDISVTERNLMGSGQFLKVSGTLAARRQEVGLSYTEPYFLGREIAAGFDIFDQRRDRQSESSFDSDSKGVTLRAAYPFTEHLTHSVHYSLRDDQITNVLDTASRFIKDQEGQTVTSLVGQSFIYDKRDNKFDPSEGYYIRVNQDVAGLGGDAKHLMHELRGSYYIPTISDKWVLSFTGRGGYIFGLGSEDVRINNRFFIGGNYIRGFETDGIGPRDTTTLDSLGGNIYYTGSTEFKFPLGTPDELGLSGSVFMDAGSLYNVDSTGPEIADDSTLRASFGAGVSWASPVGPIRIDMAHAFRKNQFDQTQSLRFSFGTRL
jgi:outer membrane protein insertion porin family